LLDLMMPEMDGRATLQQLKLDGATQAIPVILVTAKAAAKGDRFGDLAVAAVLAKPFRPLQLAADIKAILGWR
jgi:CheY-like chemotaxis protein